jgi:murein DD-endopeptidase MepM/ murein hydrolase activator NlpD
VPALPPPLSGLQQTVNQVVPGTAPSSQGSSSGAGAQPSGQGGSSAADPAAPGAAQPAAFEPPPAEQASLPNEPGRVGLESQQASLLDQSSSLDDQLGPDAQLAGGGQGEFAWPIVRRGRPYITQRFGCTDVPGEPYNPYCATRRWHTGLDLGIPTGTPVHAAAPGVVRVFRSNGNYVLITHGNGWFTLYGHLNDFLARDGQTVGRGDVVGYSGSTGFSTGPHLHFEIRHAQDYLDPCAYLNC